MMSDKPVFGEEVGRLFYLLSIMETLAPEHSLVKDFSQKCRQHLFNIVTAVTNTTEETNAKLAIILEQVKRK